MVSFLIMKRLIWKKTDPPNFENVPEKAGIYIISTRQEADHAFEVKYVDQANNLRTRIKEHWSKKEKNLKLKAHISEGYIMKLNYSEVNSQADRDGMVTYMQQIFEPPFNSGSPQGNIVINCSLPEVRKQSG